MRQVKYKCPNCGTQGTGSTGARHRLQAGYKGGKPATFSCKKCGAFSHPTTKKDLNFHYPLEKWFK